MTDEERITIEVKKGIKSSVIRKGDIVVLKCTGEHHPPAEAIKRISEKTGVKFVVLTNDQDIEILRHEMQEQDKRSLQAAWRRIDLLLELAGEKKSEARKEIEELADGIERKTTLTDGSPVTDDHRRELKPNGQQKGYVVLSEEERAKGFVRPLRKTYKHVGVRPKHPLRDLTDQEKETHEGSGYVKYEKYPEEESPKTGRMWTQKQLESGCAQTTTMGYAIAETYARNPEFYGGTFCCHCGEHFSLEQFVWEGTDEVVGS